MRRCFPKASPPSPRRCKIQSSVPRRSLRSPPVFHCISQNYPDSAAVSDRKKAFPLRRETQSTLISFSSLFCSYSSSDIHLFMQKMKLLLLQSSFSSLPYLYRFFCASSSFVKCRLLYKNIFCKMSSFVSTIFCSLIFLRSTFCKSLVITQNAVSYVFDA